LHPGPKNKMKIFLLGVGILLLISIGSAAGQDRTIVLVRHVEKDSSPTADKTDPELDKNDPELSEEGRQRAERLAKLVKRYKPHEIFSTPFKRTKGTVEPIAKRRKKEIQTYDPAKPADLVQKIMDPSSKTVHYLIVGHSNTIPALANLIAKKEIFRPLLETEFGVIWVMKIKNGVLTQIEVKPY
jgi:2,3-bisphosphoglycerate-dependent phosphoglycerate mutase